MDILAHTSADMPGEEESGIRDYPLREYPIPNGCSRFILPTELRRMLHGHPLGSDLYTRAAGHYSRDPKHDSFVQACHVVYYCIRGRMRLRSAAAADPKLPQVVYEPETPHGKEKLAASATAGMTVAKVQQAIDDKRLPEPVTSYLCADGYYARRG